MRIAYLLHEVLPAHQANTAQVVRTAASLARCGAHVDLYFPGTVDRPVSEAVGEISSFYGLEADALDGVRLREERVSPLVPGRARRIAHHLSVTHRLNTSAYDVLYVRDIAALWRGVRSGIPTLFETYRTDINRQHRYLLWRRFNYRHPGLLGVITHSRLAQRGFVRAGIPEERVLVAYNGFEPASMTPRLSADEARARLGLPSRAPLVVYTGRVGPHKGTDLLVRIAALLPDVRFLIVGAELGSPHHSAIMRLIAEAGVRNLEVLGQVPPAQVTPYLFAADCLVIPPASDPLRTHGRTVLPLKTFSYLAAGRPIVAGALPDVSEILVHDRNAILTPPDSPEAAAGALGSLLADPALMTRLSQCARRDAEAYTWEARGKRVHGYMRRLLADRNAPET